MRLLEMLQGLATCTRWVKFEILIIWDYSPPSPLLQWSCSRKSWFQSHRISLGRVIAGEQSERESYQRTWDWWSESLSCAGQACSIATSMEGIILYTGIISGRLIVRYHLYYGMIVHNYIWPYTNCSFHYFEWLSQLAETLLLEHGQVDECIKMYTDCYRWTKLAHLHAS